MRISDWSSDVCSSDLPEPEVPSNVVSIMDALKKSIAQEKYGGRAAFPEKLAKAAPAPKTLHLLARELALPDPEAGTTLRVTAPLPPHMAANWQAPGFNAAKGGGALQALLAYAEGLEIGRAHV